jgi:hypothetical protein
MENESPNEQSRRITLLWIWIAALFGLVLLSRLLSWLDDATELFPTHDSAGIAIFCVAGVSGLVTAGAAIYLSRGFAVWRRIGITFSFVLLGLLASFMMSFATANIIEGRKDFPPTKTKTYSTLILISRAYQTHGKGRSWSIQTMPLWSNLDITEDDYNFMLAHRPDAETSRNLDEISSRGYFCAQVTMQSAGGALRILHAGSNTLPRGTVIICPLDSSNIFAPR